MNAELIKALGLSPEKLQQMIVDQAVEQLLSGRGYDEDGDMVVDDSKLTKRITELAMSRINEKIEKLAAEHLLPKLDAHIDTLVLQQTTQWGEKQGAPMTVTEYLVSRANAYMGDEVDLQGRSKAESGDSYNWRKHSTRIAFAIDKHLQFHISSAMEKALKDANAVMAKGLHEACRIAINEAAAKFAVVVKQ